MSEKSENIDEMETWLSEENVFEGVTTAEGELEGEEEEAFSLIGSSDDAEKQRMYMEYLALIKDIECQNKVVADIKNQIAKLCAKECKTRCEIKNIKRLHNCLEQENLKLKCLLNRAIQLQNFGSKRHYRSIPVETTVDDDNLSPYIGAIPPTNWRTAESDSEPCSGEPCDPCSASETSGDAEGVADNTEALMCSMLQALKRKRVCCPEDKKLIKQIAATLMARQRPAPKPRQRPCDPCGGGMKSSQGFSPSNMQRPCEPCSGGMKSMRDFAASNMPCSQDSVDVLRKKARCVQAVMNKIKQEISSRERQKSECPQTSNIDNSIARLRKRLCCLQTEAKNLQREVACKERERECGGAGPNDECLIKLKKQLCAAQAAIKRLREEITGKELQKEREAYMPRPSNSIEKMRDKLCRMQSTLIAINNEISRREDDDDNADENISFVCDDDAGMEPCQEELDPMLVCAANKNTKAEQLRKLKENYLHLLREFAKKDCKLKELEQRLKGYCGSCGGHGGAGKSGVAVGGGGELNEAELEVLRCRINELREEQEEFKCIMKEQAQQLEDYRQKYLTAQQKVEEQNASLEKLNMNNKRIEKQINNEVKEIRAKFQEKLNELLQYPKLLENEQCKLSAVSKEKDDLAAKMAIICKELRSMKMREVQDKVEDCRPQLAKCTIELEQTRVAMEELQRQRDLLCEELQKVKDDLDTLRCESAKIIARTKERADQTKQQQQEQIDRLEKELAQCRATACLSVSDREAVIREMQGQLNTLSFSFDAAQKQIKTLRNHIAYVSNENCFPIKC